MKELWSQRSLRVPLYVPLERSRDEKVIRLDTNENPYPPSPRATQAIKAAASSSLRLYPDPDYRELREGISQFLDVKPERIYVGNGADEVLAMAFNAFFDPEPTIRFPDIADPRYAALASFLGIQYEQIPLDESFNVPVEPFLEHCGGVVISHPNAMTGLEVDFADLRRIIEADPERVVVVDETYVAFATRSAVELVGQYPNLLVVRSLSKCRSLAGLRVGFAVGNENLIAALNTVRDAFNPYPVDRIAQAGALGAMGDEDYFRCTISQLVSTRSWTANELRDMGFTVFESSANFLFITHKGTQVPELVRKLREKGIQVYWADNDRLRDYIRVTIGTKEDMVRFCETTKELLDQSHGA